MTLLRRRGLLLAFLVAAAIIAVREMEYFPVAYDRFHLPAFDGHVYVAMTENPAFFTVAPWGYRVLNPWLIRLVTWPWRDPVPAYFWSTVVSLALGGVLLFTYLRRLGHAALPALLALTLYGVSGPVGEVVRYQFLAEPLTFLLEMALLLSVEAGAPLGLLMLIGLLGVLSKEFFVLLLPLIWIVGRNRDGNRTALIRAAAIVLPALAMTIALRRVWTPQIHPPLPELSITTLGVASSRVAQSWRAWRGAVLLTGLTPLAVLGAFRVNGRRLAARGGYLFVAAFAPPFLNPVTFTSDDIPRLLLYALPGVLPLALAAFDGLWPRDDSPPPPTPTRHWLGPAFVGMAVVVAIAPFVVIDTYRRVDLQGTRDATLMLAVFRGSLEAGEGLKEGRPFAFDPTAGRYSRGFPIGANLSEIRRVRWFLRGGWGALATRSEGVPTMDAPEAQLLLPCLNPVDLEATLTLDAPLQTRLAIRVNGQPVADLSLGPARRASAFRIPRALLFRGDNVLSLEVVGTAAPRVRLHGFTIGPT